jgi:hypothetical protein
VGQKMGSEAWGRESRQAEDGTVSNQYSSLKLEPDCTAGTLCTLEQVSDLYKISYIAKLVRCKSVSV